MSLVAIQPPVPGHQRVLEVRLRGVDLGRWSGRTKDTKEAEHEVSCVLLGRAVEACSGISGSLDEFTQRDVAAMAVPVRTPTTAGKVARPRRPCRCTAFLSNCP